MKLLLALTLTLGIAGAGPGTAALPLLKIGQGPRATALGESFTALADDASAIYWNPAGIGRAGGLQLALSHQQWFAGIKDEVGHASIPLGPGALGLGLVYSGEPNVLYWDEEEQKFGEFLAWNALLSAGYGLPLSENYRVGAALTGLYQDLKFETGKGGVVAVGFHGEPYPGLGFGVAARHLGLISFPGGTEQLPFEAAAGAALSTGRFKFTLDGVFPVFDNSPSARGGVEFSPVDMLALRVGYRTGPVDLTGLGFGNGLTAGIGVTVGNFGIDYAMVPYGELGLTHRIGIRTSVPPPQFGSWTVTVLDRETGQRVTSTLVFSGGTDTTVTADEVTLRRLEPVRTVVRASAPGYAPAADTFTVTAGRTGRDTLRVARLFGRLTGGIYDARTSQPIGGALAYSGPLSGSLSVPAVPGTFDFAEAKPGEYRLEATGPTEDYLAQTAARTVAAGQATQADFYLWKRGDLLVLDGVNFETGKADILPEFYPVLDRAGEILQQTPSINKIELSGHTDPRGLSTPEFVEKFKDNWGLSQARADAVKEYLVEKFGIAPERITTKGYADSRPVATNDTPEGMAQNRRTELRIIE